MKRNIEMHFIIVLAVLLLILGAGTLLFVNGVSKELWTNSIQTMMENVHQGANAINIQLERDFSELELIKENLAKAGGSGQKQLLDLAEISGSSITVYSYGRKNNSVETEQDEEVRRLLSTTENDRGILDSHISNITGENVFDIFVRIPYTDGTRAFLVKEYRAKDIAEQFTLTFFDNTGFSYLVNRDGIIMIHPYQINSNKTYYSLFDMIPTEENEESLVNLFQQSIYEHKAGWARFLCDGTDLVFCYEPLRADSNWLMTSIVPESVIIAQTKSILKRTLFFSGFLIIMILASVLFLYRNRTRETRKYTRELQDALAAADKASKAKSQFMMNMSHDVRTPLNAIIGMTIIAQENKNDRNRVDECLEKISLSGKHLVSLVNDVLDMSQIENGDIKLKEETIQISQLYQEVTDLMKHPAQESNITMDTLPVRLKNTTVTGDPDRIRQIMVNIISNAIKYTPSAGHVTLELTQSEEIRDGYGTYLFRCTDTGIGIEPELLEKMFLSFERGKNTTLSGIAGIGVGLSITKGLLDLMKGSISVESEPGKGSSFTVKFRFLIREEESRKEENDIQAAAIPDHAEEEAVCDYADKHILLVDDVELNMEIMEALLDMIGAKAEKACNGKEAVELVHAKPCGYYDLIFMDIQMPVMDGYEATRQIRAMGREDAKTIPIIALSANALDEDVENSKKAGMNDHIAKPVDIDPIEKTLRCYIK